MIREPFARRRNKKINAHYASWSSLIQFKRRLTIFQVEKSYANVSFNHNITLLGFILIDQLWKLYILSGGSAKTNARIDNVVRKKPVMFV